MQDPAWIVVSCWYLNHNMGERPQFRRIPTPWQKIDLSFLALHYIVCLCDWSMSCFGSPYFYWWCSSDNIFLLETVGATSTVHLCQFALSSLVFRFNCSRSHEIHLDVNADEFLMSRWCALNADLSSTPWLVNSMFEFKFFWNAQMYFSKLYAFDRNRQSPGAGTAPCMVLYIVWLVCGKNEWKMWLLYIPLHGAVCHVTLWNQWIENVLTSAFYISLLKSMLAATSFSGLTMSRWIP